MLFISFVNKFQTPEQRADNDISLKKMCIQRKSTTAKISFLKTSDLLLLLLQKIPDKALFKILLEVVIEQLNILLSESESSLMFDDKK